MTARLDVVIRPENAEDAGELLAVDALVRDAFWDVYAPGAVEHVVLDRLRRSAAFVPKLSLIALRPFGDAPVGQIAFSRSRIEGDDGVHPSVLTLGPVAVAPLLQGRGVGSRLVEAGLEEARRLGFRAVLLMGDPVWYARFGFRRAKDFHVRLPDGSSSPGLLALELMPGALDGAAGVWRLDSAFEPTEAEAAAVDARFPERAKHAGTPSQQRFAAMLAEWKEEAERERAQGPLDA